MKANPVVATWARLLRAHALALAAVEARLKAAGMPPFAWYDVLLELDRAQAPMRPTALEAELLLSQPNLSRLLDRMEAAGVVTRARDPGDGRGRLVSPTPAGLDLRRRMWRVYGPAIREAIGGSLSPEEVRTLGDLLSRLADPLGPERPR